MTTALKNNTKSLMGNFVGSGDGFHKVEGVAKATTPRKWANFSKTRKSKSY